MNAQPHRSRFIRTRSSWPTAKAAWALLIAGPLFAQSSNDLTQASLEDLMNIQVTSVSKKEQKLSKTGASVFVITQEDIHRSGATNIPDLLRLVPGVNVTQIDAGAWGISIRGFNDRYANKVLVLVDGRSVYSANFSGVFWDQQDVPLADIERIEVIRGPGGTIWGANAVNGVINIITKSAKETQGGLIQATAGSGGRAIGLMQYGDKLGQSGSFRVFGQYSNTGEFSYPGGEPAGDGWHSSRAGFRSDWDLSSRDSLTVEGDYMKLDDSETITTLFANALPTEWTLGNADDASTIDVLGNWRHTFANGSDLSVKAYYSRENRTWLGINDRLNTVDWDVSHHFAAGSRNDIVWGFGYRFTQDRSSPGYAINPLPLYPTDNLANAFLQDEIALTDSLSLTVGTKLEHNTYTGFEFEPSAQLVWQHKAGHALWISGARAIREPARFDRSLDFDYMTTPLPGGSFALVEMLPNTHLRAEVLRDFEAGYRARLNDKVSFDLTVFLGFYSNLTTQASGVPYFVTQPGLPYLVTPLLLGNLGSGKSYGGEAFVSWTATRRWRLTGGVSPLHVQLSVPPDLGVRSLASTADSAPTNQFQVQSFLNLTRRMDWDCSLAYVGGLKDTGTGTVAAYARLDTRLGFRLGERTEISIGGQNLLSPRHLEDQAVYPVLPTEVPRSAYVRLAWRF